MNMFYKLFYAFAIFISVNTSVLAVQVADVDIKAYSIRIDAENYFDKVVVRIIGEDEYAFQKEYDKTEIVINVNELDLVKNGEYRYEVTGIKFTGETRIVNGNGREPGQELKKSIAKSISGRFEVKNYTLVERDDAQDGEQ